MPLLAAPYHVLILLLRLIMVVAASGLHAPATRGNRKVARWGLVVALVCASMIPTATASEVASTCSGDVATCVANAADGATIKIATGTHAWSTEVTVQNKRVTIVGAGEALTILDRNQGGRFFQVGDGGHVTLKHLTVTKGSANKGGVAYITGTGKFSAEHCTFSGNTADVSPAARPLRRVTLRFGLRLGVAALLCHRCVVLSRC